MEFVDIIHLRTILETSNQIDWLGSLLLTLESNHAKNISRARERLLFYFFLLSCKNSIETKCFQINHINGIASFKTLKTTINDKFFCELL